MGFREMLRGKAGEPSLYRRAWSQTDNPIVIEARAQTLAIQRLQLWLRLAYSVLALAALLGYWGFAEGGGLVAGVIGAVLGALALVCVLVLRTGITRRAPGESPSLAQPELDQIDPTPFPFPLPRADPPPRGAPSSGRPGRHPQWVTARPLSYGRCERPVPYT